MAATNFSLNDYLIIDTTGSIGIGTTTPQARLFVTSSSTVTSQPGVVFKAGTANQLGGVGLFDVQNSGGSSLLFVSGSGRVGIGATTPGAALEISTSSHASPSAIFRDSGISNSSTGIALYQGNTNGAARNWGLAINRSAFGDFAILQGLTQGSDPFAGAANIGLYIDPSRNVGIGTTNTNGNKVAISGGNLSVTGSVLPGQDNNYSLGSSSPQLRWSAVHAGNIYGNFFPTSGTPGSVLYINASGGIAQSNLQFFWDSSNNRLGIGTNSASYKLDVQDSATQVWSRLLNRSTLVNSIATQIISANNGTMTYQVDVDGLGSVFGSGARLGMATNHFLSFMTNGAEVARFDTSGRLGVGNSSPSVRLDVSGSYSVGVERARVWGPLNLKYSTDTFSGKDYQIGSGYELDGTAHGSGGFVLYHRWGDSGLGNGGWKMIFGSASTPTLTMVNQTVGIGTTVMSAKFHVQGSSTTSTSTVLIKESQAMASGVATLDVQNSAGTSLLFVSGSGRVGINSSAPTAELTVRYATANSSTTSPALLIDNPSGGAQTALTLAINGVEKSRLRVDNSGNLVINAPGVFYFGYDNSHSGFRFYNGTGSRQVDIDTSGNVGIGTATMSNKLSIYGTAQDQVYIRGGSTNRAGIRIDNTAGYQSQILLADGNTDKWQFGKQTDNTFFLYDATAAVNIIQGTYRATGRSDIALVPYQHGRAGIGTDPAGNGKLEIYATGSLEGIFQSDGTRWLRILAGTSTSGAYNNIVSTNDYALIFSGSKATNTPSLVLAPWDGAGATSGLKIDPSGNVGIGTATMSRKLVVHGSDALINGVAVGTGNNSSDTYNTAVGDSANGALTTGSGNTAVGRAALITVSTGNNNVAVGSSALQSQTASNATAVGTSALWQSTATGNTAVGYNALSSITANSGSVAVGYEALKNATGSENTALGWRAGNLVSSGNNNIAIGSEALRSVTTTNSNIAMGYRALELSTGGSNTVIGTAAGFRLTTGGSNVGLGALTLAASSAMSGSTAIGTAALSNATGDGNTGLGFSAGSAITSGVGNVILGSFTGNAGGLDIRTGNNNIVLSDGQGNVRTRIDRTGAVGIGTATPVADYTVTIASGSTANAADLNSRVLLYTSALDRDTGYWLQSLSHAAYFRTFSNGTATRIGTLSSTPLRFDTAGTEAVTIDTSQNVGIGTSSTGGEALRIYRSSGATAAIYSNTSNATIGLTGYNSTTPVTAALEVSSTAVSIGAVTNHPLRLLTNSTEAMRINTSQNVGIGTATVGARLHVHSGASDEVTRFESTGNPYISLYDSGTRTGYLYSNTSTLELVSEATKDLMLQGAGAVIIKSNGNNERIRVLSGGKVGFGTNNPSEIIESYGTDAGIIVHYSGQSRGGLWAFSSQRVAVATTASSDDVVFGYTGSPGSSAAFVERMRVDNSTGYVGIGTNGPADYLDVRGGFQTQAMYPRLNNTYNIGYSLVGIATAAYSNVYSYAYPSLSDYRLKEEIREISGSLPKIANLRPVVYRYNDILENVENLGDRVGFIAHELQEQFPSLVRGEKDAINEANGIPKMQEIYQDDLLPYMVDAIKELKSQNDSLKTEIQSLKDQISSILTMLSNK